MRIGSPSFVRIFMEDLHTLTSERRLPFHERLVQHFSEADQPPVQSITRTIDLMPGCLSSLLASSRQQ